MVPHLIQLKKKPNVLIMIVQEKIIDTQAAVIRVPPVFVVYTKKRYVLDASEN